MPGPGAERRVGVRVGGRRLVHGSRSAASSNGGPSHRLRRCRRCGSSGMPPGGRWRSQTRTVSAMQEEANSHSPHGPSSSLPRCGCQGVRPFSELRRSVPVPDSRRLCRRAVDVLGGENRRQRLGGRTHIGDVVRGEGDRSDLAILEAAPRRPHRRVVRHRGPIGAGRATLSVMVLRTFLRIGAACRRYGRVARAAGRRLRSWTVPRRRCPSATSRP
jgi:hypothetical protein